MVGNKVVVFLNVLLQVLHALCRLVYFLFGEFYLLRLEFYFLAERVIFPVVAHIVDLLLIACY